VRGLVYSLLHLPFKPLLNHFSSVVVPPAMRGSTAKSNSLACINIPLATLIATEESISCVRRVLRMGNTYGLFGLTISFFLLPGLTFGI
jgi:hypothetical protein